MPQTAYLKLIYKSATLEGIKKSPEAQRHIWTLKFNKPMQKYNAVVAYSIKRNGSKRGFLVIVHYDDEDISNEKIIELANEKITEDSEYLHFTIESEGFIHTRNKVN